MSRLYRPHIPLKVRCEVAMRQLEWPEPKRAIEAHRGKLGALWNTLLLRLSTKLLCDVKELRLDHDPPLGARPLMHKRKTGTIVYKPEANDPNYLFYRPHGPQHERSHLIKTNVRGDHGQHPDRVLIKKARKLEASRNGETRRKATRFPKSTSRVNRITDSRPRIRSRGFAKVKRPFTKRRS